MPWPFFSICMVPIKKKTKIYRRTYQVFLPTVVTIPLNVIFNCIKCISNTYFSNCIATLKSEMLMQATDFYTKFMWREPQPVGCWYEIFVVGTSIPFILTFIALRLWYMFTSLLWKKKKKNLILQWGCFVELVISVSRTYMSATLMFRSSCSKTSSFFIRTMNLCSEVQSWTKTW